MNVYRNMKIITVLLWPDQARARGLRGAVGVTDRALRRKKIS